MAKGKVFKNYIYNTAYQVLLVITPLITSPYLARTLKATSVGIFNYGYSIITYFVLFGTLGSSLFAQREVAYFQDDKQKRSKAFGEMLVFRIITLLISSLIYVGFVFSVKEYRLLYFVLFLELISNMVDVTWFFQGMEEFGKIVARNTVFKLLGVTSIFIFVKSPEDIYKYTLCFILPTLIGNLSLWIYLPKYLVKTKVEFKSVLGYVKPMIALFIPQIAIEVYTVLDKTMVGIISPNIDNVAFYTYSQNIIKAVLQLITSLSVVMLPAMTNAFAKGKNDEIASMMKKSVQFVFMLGCPMMFGIAACANNFVIWFYGKEFSVVGPLMMVASPIILAIGMSTVVGRQYLVPSKRQKVFTLAVVGGAVTNFVLNLILIRFYNAFGASVATVIAEMVVIIIEVICIRKQIPILSDIKRCLKYVLYAAIMFAVIFPISLCLDGVLCTMVQGFVGIIIYMALILITRDKEAMAFLDSVKEKFIKKKKV